MSERGGGFGAFLFGIVLGAVAGFVFAPTEGGESTRRKVTKGLRNLKELAEEKVDEARADAEAVSAARAEVKRRVLDARRRRHAIGAARRGGATAEEEDEPLA